MAWKIKPGKMIMQNGKLYAEGCILAKVEADLADLVEETDAAPGEYMEKNVNGVPTYVINAQLADELEIRTVSTTTDSIINNPDVNPLQDLSSEEPVKKAGRPKKTS